MNVGAIGALRRVKNAISVARHVLEHTTHSFLVGDQATEFAIQMGFKEESLTTSTSKKMWMKWHNEDHCQPNAWMVRVPNIGTINIKQYIICRPLACTSKEKKKKHLFILLRHQHVETTLSLQ